ncbi:hypothetical protein [Sphingobacterium spiritivorum]|nr:hypothetical protein [Sphingobacterium spiritivorum]QQS94880.1 hypothetical protein I6J03_16065 [Sphingobacterium spiritivorum]
MFKFLIILGLIGLVIYFVSRKLSGLTGSPSGAIRKGQFLLMHTPTALITKVSKKTFVNVGIGIILLLIVVLLAVKIKILLFLLPISFYMIGQLFVLTNHVKATRNQQIWFDPQQEEVIVESLNKQTIRFKLQTDVKAVQQIEAVQHTNGVVFGYYRMKTTAGIVEIPYLVMKNDAVYQCFTNAVHKHFSPSLQKRLFPII